MRKTRRFLVLLIVGLVPMLALLGNGANAQAASGHYISGVPLYGQQHNLSCEYASARMVTAYWGNGISENQLINAIGYAANPHLV